MRKTIISILTAIIIAIGGTAGVATYLGSTIDIGQTLVGTADNAIKLPISQVVANSTTTDAAVGGGFVNQLVNIDGVDRVNLGGIALGGTATSTLIIRPQVSFDGTNYFDITGSSTSTDQIGTTTWPLVPSTFSFDPGTASTTFSYVFDVTGKYLRLIFMGEDVSTDPSDGVEAFIQVGVEQGY